MCDTSRKCLLSILVEENNSFGVRLAILRFIVELAGVSGLHSCVASEGLWAKSLSLTFDSIEGIGPSNPPERTRTVKNSARQRTAQQRVLTEYSLEKMAN